MRTLSSFAAAIRLQQGELPKALELAQRAVEEGQLCDERDALAKADALLAALQSGEALDSNIMSLSGLLPRRFDDASETTVAGQFGGEFSAALFALDIEQWTGPVQSPFGTHLVRIDQIVEARVPLLDEIRDVVQREWLMDRRQAGQAALFDQLRAKYVITIEEFDDSSL